ncbi:GFA family protein [Vibrio coralliilyticus]|uniref:GFA family protein n=1 Tax=Vibrio TaxID=662 RepID=UPI000501B305|nr:MULTISPECIES: GFA family protein [Vibrio]KFI09872.1 aldehyde-activating protein [Vibrio sp. B183]NOI20252.1 GFA family protein [Vibrio coralliilyticus]
MKGTCLCGFVEVQAEEEHEVSLCHCNMCRQWSGGPLHAIHCHSKVQFSGNSIKRYRSSEWAERGFCSTCGTHLFYYLIPGDEYVLSVGLFQEHSFSLKNEIFVDEKPGYYELNSGSHKMTAQQVFEQFAPKES